MTQGGINVVLYCLAEKQDVTVFERPLGFCWFGE